jgi:hypothetical protein
MRTIFLPQWPGARFAPSRIGAIWLIKRFADTVTLFVGGKSMKILRVAVAAAAVFALLPDMALAEAQTKWKRFQPSDGGYRIEFPGTPTVKRDALPSRVGPAPHLEAKLTSGGFLYSVELTTYASASDPEAALDLFANAFIKNRKMLAQTRLKVGPDLARRLEIEMEEGQVVATVLLVTDGTRVYQVSCFSLKGSEHSANVKHFVDSFALVQQ